MRFFVQLTRFQLTLSVARSLCDSRAPCNRRLRPARCSRSRKEAILGFQNGCIRSYVLLDKKDLSQLGPYGTRWVHDRQYGDITSVAFSNDDRYVFSTGLDGNFFVYQTAETHRFAFGVKQLAEPAIVPVSVTVSPT